MRWFTRYFFRGLFVILPVIATVYAVYVVFEKLNDLLFARVGREVARLLEWDVAGVVSNGLGVVATVLVIIGAGVFSSNFLGRGMVRLVERWIDRVPLVKLLYGAIRDLLGAFVGDKKSFDRPVAVRLTETGDTRALGFVTQDDLGVLGLNDQVAVYLPHSYNFSGQLLVVPKDRIQPVTAESSDLMKFVVSGGVASSNEEEESED